MLFFLLINMFFETIKCGNELELYIDDDGKFIIVKGFVVGHPTKMDVKEYRESMPFFTQKSIEICKIQIEKIKAYMRNERFCSSFSYEFCISGTNFEQGKTVFLQIIPSDKDKGMIQPSFLEESIVVNKGEALNVIQNLGISMKISRKHPFFQDETSAAESVDDMPGPSRKRRRSETETETEGPACKRTTTDLTDNESSSKEKYNLTFVDVDTVEYVNRKNKDDEDSNSSCECALNVSLPINLPSPKSEKLSVSKKKRKSESSSSSD